MELFINTDGASRGNPGEASYGFIIKNGQGVILHQEGRALGVKTNNYAEYTAVLKALEYVKERYRSPHIITVIADSQLIVRQLSGQYKVKNPQLKELFVQIKSLEFDLGRISYSHVPRSQNFIADRLANQALDLLH